MPAPTLVTVTAVAGTATVRTRMVATGAVAHVGPITAVAGSTSLVQNPIIVTGAVCRVTVTALAGERSMGLFPALGRSSVLRGSARELADGAWRVYVTPPGGEQTEVSEVRGVVTEIGELQDEDPFSWTDTTLKFGGCSFFDRKGEADLWWMVPGADVDIVWDGPLPANYPYARLAYEGYFEDFHEDDVSITADVKGALYQVDNHKAKPQHLAQPIPYEVAIASQWDADSSLRVSRPVVEFPSWWTQRFTMKPKLNAAFILTGLRYGALWTGMTTRDTGTFDDALTGYIGTLLGGMYTPRGRWSLLLDPDRKAVLRHVDYALVKTPSTVIVDPASPAIKPKFDELHSQSANVWYGSGKSLEGVGYTGEEISADGERTRFKPLAALRQVEPDTDGNGWFQSERMRREAVVQAQEGLDAEQLRTIGQYQLRTFADPGLTGTVEIACDLRLVGGGILPRWAIRAGMMIVMPGVHGTEMLFHVAKAARNLAAKTVIITIDSKFRDFQTVDQVRNKGRDALNIPRLLIGGQYSPPLQDMLVPWSYAEGSGYVPGGAGLSSQRLFDGMPDDMDFPWEAWTKARPPKKAAWRNCYIGIGAKSSTADNNWAYAAQRGGGKLAIPIRMAEAATIRMFQLAAYDADGNVLPVPFHVSLYTSNGTNVGAMPKIPGPAGVDDYAPGQRYPFFAGAWERYGGDGTQISTEITVPVSSAGFVKGWGTGRVKAGYWPGSSGGSHLPTGLLQDTDPFQIKAPTGDGNGDWGIDPFTTKQASTYAGYLYLMVYCDAQQDQPVFFAGRFFREEPTT